MYSTKCQPPQHDADPAPTIEFFSIVPLNGLPSRTVTDANFAAFQVVSGDNHPIHYDVEYCLRQGHPGLLAHGLQVLCFSAAGAGLLPHVMGEALVGFIEQSSKFLKPVYAGDTLYPRLTIAALTPQRSTGVLTVASTIHNQRGECVMTGEQKYLVRLGQGTGSPAWR